MFILGLNAYHPDSSACLLRDGELVAAAEEERFRRIKHWAGFPSEATRYCLLQGGVRLSEIDYVAVNRDPRANLFRKARFALAKRPSPKLLSERLSNARKWGSVRGALQAAFPSEPLTGKIHHVEHHLAHLASSFLVSPFDEAVVVSVDGSGDFSTAAWGVGAGTTISIDGRTYFPHSLGIYYQAMTQFLGFPNYGDEYKVMGLAPYGEPKLVEDVQRLVQHQPDGSSRLELSFFRHDSDSVNYTWNDCAPTVGNLYSPQLESLLGPARDPNGPLDQRHRDLARSVQVVFEEAVFHLLNAAHQRYGLNDLALSGGCAMNSVANGKVYERTGFRRLYAPPAPGDSGGAIGAALVTWHKLGGVQRTTPMDHASWGPEYDRTALSGLLTSTREALADQGCSVEPVADETALCEKTAQAVSQGLVVGWFQGRMEWGPRALGNRSIICDPRRSDMKDIVNLKIKRRESFRPFAPSILREAVPDWFETDDDEPFMLKVFQIREEKRALVPAVTHVDGSGRLQTVHRDASPLYHRLIESFAAITGVPLVLNTSFNENEPIVCQPQEALDCFLRTKMDVLVLGCYYIERRAE